MHPITLTGLLPAATNRPSKKDGTDAIDVIERWVAGMPSLTTRHDQTLRVRVPFVRATYSVISETQVIATVNRSPLCTGLGAALNTHKACSYG